MTFIDFLKKIQPGSTHDVSPVETRTLRALSPMYKLSGTLYVPLVRLGNFSEYSFNSFGPQDVNHTGFQSHTVIYVASHHWVRQHEQK